MAGEGPHEVDSQLPAARGGGADAVPAVKKSVAKMGGYPMKKIQVTYFFEDSGFCKDVFKSVDIPHYYYNRDTASGVWYTSTPDYYANDRRIQRDVIIEVVAGGRVIALDGNGDFEGKRPFVPFNEFEKALANSFAGQQPKLRSYEEMKAKLLSLPGGEAYADPHRYWENWVFNLDFRHVTEQIVGAASWMGVEFHILAIQYTHIPTGFVFTNYRFRPASLPSGSDSRDLLLYDWQAEDLSAALPDQSGINKNKEE